MNLSISLTVNGVRRDVALGDPRVTLLDLLRERLNLTRTKKGCDRGQYGAGDESCGDDGDRSPRSFFCSPL